ncbi:hypothetical protein PG996_003135 [Apiospora saccharicola]|uniref:Uncharacterized protein n=1 Tax=Apiospora saccharicola TaxID=335842 RepID=A0ABR1W0F3_9PEZI
MSSQLLKDGDTFIDCSILPHESHISSGFQTEGFATVPLESEYPLKNPSPEDIASSSAYESSFFSDSSSTVPELDHRRARTFRNKLGLTGLIILTVGTICLLGTPCFLIFLWQGARQVGMHKDPGRVWTNVVFSNWATRSITICATIIRSAITAQAALITSMVASVLLESAGVKLVDMPMLSVLRAIRVSPFNLLSLDLLKGGRPRLVRLLCTTAIIIGSVLMVVSQLTSTILLSDFNVTSIPAPQASNPLIIGGFIIGGDSNNYGYGSAPANWWRFAEYNGSPRNVTEIGSTTFTDTGRVFRAAIPSSDQMFRENLRRYEGQANSWDARVVCLNPMLSHISFSTNDYYDTAELHGTITFDLTNDTYSGLRVGSSVNGTQASFTCTVPYRDGASICILDSDISLKGPTEDVQPLYNEMAGRYVLVRWNFSPNETRMESDETLADLKTLVNISTNAWPRDWQQQHRESWTELISPSGEDVFGVSACFTMDGLPTTGQPVYMSANSSSLEPKLGYTRSASKPLLASQEPTLQIRGQMGVYCDEQTLEERGVLSLEFQDGHCHNRFSLSGNSSHRDEVVLGGLGAALSRSRTLPLSVNRQLITMVDKSERKVQQAHACLVLDVLATADNPALAVQSLSTALIQMLHFDEDYRWNTTVPASYTVATEVTMPSSRVGLFSVIAMIAVHLFVLAVIVLPVFLSQTKVTLLGNMWLAVSQIMSDRTLEILAHSHDLTDKEVTKVIHGPRKGPGLPGVIRRRHNGRAEFGSR